MCPKYFPCQNYENYETAHLCPGTKIGCALCDLYLPNTCGVVCPIAGFYCGNYFNFTLTFRISLIYKFVKPLKIWAHLDKFFFHGFQGGTKGKNAEKTMYSFCNFSAFFLWPLLWNSEKKVVLKSLNVVRFQKISNPAFAKNFSCLS